jgi:hypothetical protein
MHGGSLANDGNNIVTKRGFREEGAAATPKGYPDSAAAAYFGRAGGGGTPE